MLGPALHRCEADETWMMRMDEGPLALPAGPRALLQLNLAEYPSICWSPAPDVAYCRKSTSTGTSTAMLYIATSTVLAYVYGTAAGFITRTVLVPGGDLVRVRV